MPTSNPVVRFDTARNDPALAVLEGLHALKHALRFGATIVEAVTPDLPSLLMLAQRLAPDIAAAIEGCVTPVAADVFRQLAPQPVDTGVIALAERPRYGGSVLADLAADRPVVLLEDPAHGGNVGAVIRVAAAADAAAVLTTGMHDPWNAGALRGSAGLHFALPVMRARSDDLPLRPVIAIDPGGGDVLAPALPAGALFMFGSERRGLSAGMLRRADRRVRIPMRAGVSSLNLATAVAVTLYTIRSGR